MTQDEIKCPKCNSNQLSANKKGFSGKKAVAGAVLTGGIGLLAGTLGSNKIIITCLACSNQFRPGEEIKKKKKEFERQQTEEAMKKPGYWIVLIIMFALIIWLLKSCF
jgi:DNA-directed RNA polymerase subunit RPC12/RpoP